MGLMLAYPQRMGGGWKEQMNALYKSQCEVIDQLNLADWSAEAVLKEITQGIDEDAALKTQQEKNLTGFASLKQLVIQTADFAMENSEVFTKVFSGSYVAKSDFGEYVKNTQLTLEANSEGITQLYEYTDGINNQYTGQSRQYVKTGLLYYDGVTPRYGVGVGNISTKIQSGNEIIDQSAGEAVTVTPGRLSFWQQGLEVAYLTDKVLHFPSGTLEALGAKISGEITATKLTISENAEISGLYLEKFKLRGQLAVYEVSIAETLVGYLGAATETDEETGEVYKTISLKSPNDSKVSIEDGFIWIGAFDETDSGATIIRPKKITMRVQNTPSGTAARVELAATVNKQYFAPGSNASITLGHETRVWESVWALDDVIQTSDREKKNAISYDMTRYATLFDRLKPVHYKLNAGTSGRTHVGMIAQDVEEAMNAVGLTGQEFAGMCKAQNEDGGWDYFLRYGEFIAICVDQIQKLKARVAELEAKG